MYVVYIVSISAGGESYKITFLGHPLHPLHPSWIIDCIEIATTKAGDVHLVQAASEESIIFNSCFLVGNNGNQCFKSTPIMTGSRSGFSRRAGPQK